MPSGRKTLILTIPHGAAHQRTAHALQRALRETEPNFWVEVVNALDHYPQWFRAYYNSYRIPLKYWPALWGWVERVQHAKTATAPGWLLRRGARPLLRFLQMVDPHIVIVTEVGICEMAAMLKRETPARFYLVAAPPSVDIDRAWAQSEVDLYTVAPGEAVANLRAEGVSDAKILASGVPIDPLFASPPERTKARERLQIERDVPLILVEFGGAGYGNPRQIFAELTKLQQAVQVVFIAGRNRSIELELQHLCAGYSRFRVLGWVDNIHEWMAAADLLVGKPGGAVMVEAVSSGLPLLAFDPLPGEERRNCALIEKWGVGCWVKSSESLAPTITRLLSNPDELQTIRKCAEALARPRAAYETAEEIVKRCTASCTLAGC